MMMMMEHQWSVMVMISVQIGCTIKPLKLILLSGAENSLPTVRLVANIARTFRLQSQMQIGLVFSAGMTRG